MTFLRDISSSINRDNLENVLYYLRESGVRVTVKDLARKLRDRVYGISQKRYERWILENEPGPEELAAQSKRRFDVEPVISIITPVFNTPENFLREMLESVLAQTYGRWELCIADGASTEGHVKRILDGYAERDGRIKLKYLAENRHIAGNSNEALTLAAGDFITFLDHDDTLAPFALYEVVRAINANPEADFLYSDEDKLTEDGRVRFLPHFKPDFSPDTLRSHNYITHLTVIKRDLLDRAGPLRPGYDGSQDYDLILRATEKARAVVHIPKVLYHWRFSTGSASGNRRAKMYAYESAKKALADHLERQGLEGTVEDGLFLSSYIIRYRIKGRPRVSVIVSGGDVGRCVDSVTGKSTWKNYEVIVVDTGGKAGRLRESGGVRVERWKGPLNLSEMRNRGAALAEGDFLIFLDGSVEVISTDWMERMLELARRSDVGAVGAKLLYPDRTVRHGGVIVGVAGTAGHAHRHFPSASHGYFGRLGIVQNLSAVTGASLMTRKEVFDGAGGFDPSYATDLGAVDLCLRLGEKGFSVLFTPFAEFFQFDSDAGVVGHASGTESRGDEKKLFRKRWKKILEEGDPFYSPNLTLTAEDFSVRLKGEAGA